MVPAKLGSAGLPLGFPDPSPEIVPPPRTVIVKRKMIGAPTVTYARTVPGRAPLASPSSRISLQAQWARCRCAVSAARSVRAKRARAAPKLVEVVVLATSTSSTTHFNIVCERHRVEVVWVVECINQGAKSRVFRVSSIRTFACGNTLYANPTSFCVMPRPHSDELPANMAVLGLVIERPNQTSAFYAKGLAERFPRADFGGSTAHTALRQLAQGEKPRLRRTRRTSGGDDSLDLFEPLAFGLDEFRSWMFRPPSAIPAVRQALYGRIELTRLEDLPQLIRTIREEEVIATALYARASGDLHKHNLESTDRGDGSKSRADFEREIRETWLYVGPLHWSSRGTLCEVVLERLEEIAHEAGIDLPNLPMTATSVVSPRQRRAS
jgi:hypothetical protein